MVETMVFLCDKKTLLKYIKQATKITTTRVFYFVVNMFF